MFAPMLRAASRSTSTHFLRRSGFESNTATPTTPPDNRPSDLRKEVTDAHARDSPMRICPNCGDGGAEPSDDARGLVPGRGASGSGLKNANVPDVGAGSRGGGGRPPGRPNMGGVQSDVCACLEEQRPAIFEKVAPASTLLVDTSGLSMDTDGMSRVAGAGVGAAEDGATSGVVRGESVIASPWSGAGGGGAMIFRCEGLGGLSVMAEAMVAALLAEFWPALRASGEAWPVSTTNLIWR